MADQNKIACPFCGVSGHDDLQELAAHIRECSVYGDARRAGSLIDCPHCAGTGTVPEDFLTDDHVSEVFSDYCEVFGIHLAYGVERWHESSGGVYILQDRSCRSCYNSEDYTLPSAYFTRDRNKRLELMRADFVKHQRAEERAALAKKQAALAEHEKSAARIRAELETKP